MLLADVCYLEESGETMLLGPAVSAPYVSVWNIEGMRHDKEKIKCFEKNRFQCHQKSHVDYCWIDSGLFVVRTQQITA